MGCLAPMQDAHLKRLLPCLVLFELWLKAVDTKTFLALGSFQHRAPFSGTIASVTQAYPFGQFRCEEVPFREDSPRANARELDGLLAANRTHPPEEGQIGRSAEARQTGNLQPTYLVFKIENPCLGRLSDSVSPTRESVTWTR